MNDEAQRTLELFIEKAERLSRFVRENHAPRGLVVNPGGLMGIFRENDGEEWEIASTLEGFLATFRMFVQARDKIALYSLERDPQGQVKKRKPRLLDLAGLSAEWYEKVERVYATIDLALAVVPPKLIYNDQPITRREVLETFLYGDYVHVTRRELFQQWRSQKDVFAELQFEFVTILGFLFGQILDVAEACRHELRQSDD